MAPLERQSCVGVVGVAEPSPSLNRTIVAPSKLQIGPPVDSITGEDLVVELQATSSSSSSSSTTTITAPKRKTVRFGWLATSDPTTQITTISIPHYTELELSVRQQLWFTQQEMDRILQEATQTVVAMKQQPGECSGTTVPLGIIADDDPDFTTRGLEYMSPEGFDITTMSLEVVKLVLEEQERQKTQPDFTGMLNAEWIAATVGGISRHRLRIAHLAAMIDARAVYGEGKFKKDNNAAAEAARYGGRPLKSKSVDGKREPQRGLLVATGSMNAVIDTTRRRRGSRGGLPRRRSNFSES